MPGMKRILEKALSDDCTSKDIEMVIASADKEISEWEEFIKYCKQTLVDMQGCEYGC